VLIILIPISSIIGLSCLNPNRRCGTGDILAIMFFVFLFYCFWALGLLIEAYFLNKKQNFEKRNLNIIMALTIPFLIFLSYLYFEIIEIFN
jgi:hypothetical protein